MTAPLLRPLWRAVPTCVVLTLVAAVGRLTLPFTVQRLVDSIAKGEEIDTVALLELAGVAAVVLALASTCGALLSHRLNRALETVLVDLRGRLLRHLHSLTELDRNVFQRGALVSRLTSDLEQVTGYLERGGAYVVLNCAQLVLTLGLMFCYSWPLTLVIVVLLLPLIRVLPALQGRLNRAYTEVHERNSRMLALVGESVAGGVVIRAYGAQRLFKTRLVSAVSHLYAAQRHGQKVAAYAFVIGEATVAVMTAALLSLGMVLGAGGHVTLGVLTAFLFLTVLLTQPLQATAENLNDLQNAIAAARRVRDLLVTAPSVTDPAEAEARPLPGGALGIEVDTVSFTYPGADGPAVNGISLSVPQGRKIAIVGETGSGKSTLLSLLTRAADPATGSVRLVGDGEVDLRRLRTADLRAAVHLVPQDGYLLGNTIADNLRLAVPGLSDHRIRAAFTSLGLAEWLATLPDGIDTPVGDGGRSLSAGERQLVALARAYAADPPVLLLDEATSNLDPLTEHRISDAVEVVSRGRTTVTVAHRLSAAENADEVLVMADARFVQSGPHRELVVQPGRYADLHATWRRRTQPTTVAPG